MEASLFNSLRQWTQYHGTINHRHHSVGLRINPEYSEVEASIYNPCLPYSRFGITRKVLGHQDMPNIEGFHLHTICDQCVETFVRVSEHTVNNFGDILPRLSVVWREILSMNTN